MSINVNNLSKADLVKLAMNKQSGKTTAANQPSYMTKNGSIFNAPNAKQTAQTKESKPTTLSEGIEKLNNTKNSQEAKSYDNIDNIKTAEQGRKAIADLKEDMQDMSPLQRALQRVPLQLKLNKLEEKQKDLAKQEFEDSQANLKSIAQGNGAIDKDGTSSTKSTTSKDGGNVSAEEGKAMANDAESENAKLEKQTAQTEKDAQEVEGYQKDAKKTQKDIKKDEAKFNKEIAKESKTISKNQAEMAKESEQMTQTRTEIDALQAELQSLTADSTGMGERSAFSLKLAGDNSQQTNGGSNSNSTSGMDDTNSRVAELQAQIGEKADTMQVRGQKLQKLQTSTNKSITVMHNKVRLKSIYYTKAQKTMETEQKTTDKIMKVADKIDNISQTVTQVGKTLQYVGKGMIIAVNKWDLVEKDNTTMKKFTEKIREKLSYMPYAELIFLSAKTGQRLPKLFDMIDAVIENCALRVQTGVLNEILTEAMAMKQPPSDKGKRLRIYYITQVSVKPPTFVMFINEKKLTHFSYTRYIENQIRTTFGFRGTPIHFIYRERKEK